jgi:hypothetical protein
MTDDDLRWLDLCAKARGHRDVIERIVTEMEWMRSRGYSLRMIENEFRINDSGCVDLVLKVRGYRPPREEGYDGEGL